MKVGFIGLGRMGQGMARNLLKSGVSLMVYDVSPASVETLTKAGAPAWRGRVAAASRTAKRTRSSAIGTLRTSAWKASTSSPVKMVAIFSPPMEVVRW